MGDTADDYLCERLLEWGVGTIYGFPGDGINGILAPKEGLPGALEAVREFAEEFVPGR